MLRTMYRVMAVLAIGSLQLITGCGEDVPPIANETAEEQSSARWSAEELSDMDTASATIYRVVHEEAERLYESDIEKLLDCKEQTVYPRRPYGHKRMDDDEATMISRTCRKLRILNIQQSPLTDTGLMKLAELPDLQVLILGSANVTELGLQQFQRLKPDCVVRRFPKNVMYALGAAGSQPDFSADSLLVGIGLGSYVHSIIDDDVSAIANFHEVEYFVADADGNFANPDDFQLTDLSMKTLSKLPRLQHVKILASPQITDEGLRHFHGHPSLEALWIDQNDTAITDKGIEEFRKAMPHCDLLVHLHR